MTKRIISILVTLIFLFNSSPTICYAGIEELLIGIGLVSGGLFIAVDGFSTVKVVDKEWNEKVKEREWYETVIEKEWHWLSYEYHEDWTLETGWAHVYPDPSPESIKSYWWVENWSGYPGDYNCYEWNHHITYETEYRVTYGTEHFVIYKKKIKSVLEGAIGLSAMGYGSYMIIDYLVDLNKLKKKAGIEIKVTKRKDTTYLSCSKNF